MRKIVGLLLAATLALAPMPALAQQQYDTGGKARVSLYPAPGTPSPIPVTAAPGSASTAGIAPVRSSVVETGHVIKASAGNLYSLDVTADATLSAAAWAIMVFNSTTVPAAGAVTPAWCMLLPAGATGYAGAFPTPMYLGTGISIAVSVGQTCFTKTDSAHGFISANAQ